jgi:hypothetical protein
MLIGCFECNHGHIKIAILVESRDTYFEVIGINGNAKPIVYSLHNPSPFQLNSQLTVAKLKIIGFVPLERISPSDIVGYADAKFVWSGCRCVASLHFEPPPTLANRESPNTLRYKGNC